MRSRELALVADERQASYYLWHFLASFGTEFAQMENGKSDRNLPNPSADVLCGFML